MSDKTFLYVSCWIRGTQKDEAGIYVYSMDRATRELTLVEKVDTEMRFNASRIDPERNLLYVLNETDRLPEARAVGGGRIFVYRIDPDTGKLTRIGVKPTWCSSPCFITLDAEKKYAVVANHGSKGAVTKIAQDAFGKYYLNVEFDDTAVELFEVLPDGTLGELLDVQKHYGSGTEARQLIAHPHCAVMSPDGTLFAVCDKGNDTVRMYSIDREHNRLKLNAAPVQCAPETLPRYSVFHPSLPYFYHNNEKLMKLFAYRYEADGSLKRIAEVSALPEGYTPAPKAVHEQQGLSIHPNGKYIYDISRGPNVVAVYEIDESNGVPTLVQTMPVPDAWPRGCTISADGSFLAVAGLDQGKVFVYAVGENGLLQPDFTEVNNPYAAYISILE